MNWKLFWLRLTIVISIIVYIVPVLYFIAYDPWHFYDYERLSDGYRRIRTFETWQSAFAAVEYLIVSILFPTIVWIMYFTIRWVYRGLKL